MEKTLHESKSQERKRLVGSGSQPRLKRNSVSDRDGEEAQSRPNNIPFRLLAGDLLRASASLECFSGVSMPIIWPATQRLDALNPGASVL